jgi:hypothetical protein
MHQILESLSRLDRTDAPTFTLDLSALDTNAVRSAASELLPERCELTPDDSHVALTISPPVSRAALGAFFTRLIELSAQLP